MSHTQANITGAIARSISYDEIVTVQVTDIDEAYTALTTECDPEGCVDTFGGYDADHPMREVWGTTDDGDDWRVHLILA